MHIADGILNTGVAITSFAVTGGITAYLLLKTKKDDIPRISSITALLFVASIFHIKLGPIAFHPLLTGAAAFILGPQVFIAALVALFFQALMFGHGGITALGANTLSIGGGALLVSIIYIFISGMIKKRIPFYILSFIFGFICIVISTMITLLLLMSTGESFTQLIKAITIAQIPLAIVEGTITLFITIFFTRVKPELLHFAKY